MERYRHIDMSPRLLPVDLQAQRVSRSFAQALHHLVDQLDLSAFDALYRDDEKWLAEHLDDRPGSRGRIRKSNRTDNESAKLATDKELEPLAQPCVHASPRNRRR